MAAITVYDPRGLEFKQWANYLVELFAEQNLSVADDDTDWQEWGLALIGNAYFAQYEVPLPTLFDSWEEWAYRVIQSEINPGAQ